MSNLKINWYLNQIKLGINKSESVKKLHLLCSNESEDNEFVDLGLPSGTLWCTHNLGASKPEEPGIYYAFGDPKPYTVTYDNDGYPVLCDAEGNLKHHYQIYWDDYKFASYDEDGNAISLKYNYSFDNGTPDFLTELQPEDDIATQHDSSWRTPSYEELLELMNNTNYEYDKSTQLLKLTSKTNGNSIIIPIVYSDCFVISKSISDGCSDSSMTPCQVYGLMRTYSYEPTVSDSISYGYNFLKNPYAIRPVKGGKSTKPEKTYVEFYYEKDSNYNSLGVLLYAKLMRSILNQEPFCFATGNSILSVNWAKMDLNHTVIINTWLYQKYNDSIPTQTTIQITPDRSVKEFTS